MSTASPAAATALMPHDSPPLSAGFTNDATEPPRFNLVDLILKAGVAEFTVLHSLRAKGWSDTRMDTHFQHQRQNADHAEKDLSLHWMRKMKTAFQEIDEHTGCVPLSVNLQFIDLGCCPGGFTSYILERNINATGFGVSLEAEKGGHACLLAPPDMLRFELCSTDLTYFQLGTSVLDDSRLNPLPLQIRMKSSQLAVLDGHHLRTQDGIRKWDWERLLISQLIIALEGVENGGNIVLKLGQPELVRTAKLLHLLDTICAELVLYKPVSMHANRGSFYAIAKGLGMGACANRLPSFIAALRDLWTTLTFGGDDGSGRFLLESDLDFIINTSDLLDTYVPRLTELARDVWLTQAKALNALLRKNRIPTHDVVWPKA